MTTGRRRRGIALAVAIIASLVPMCAACAKTLANPNDDLTITARVKTALLNDPGIGATKIDVDTSAGVVTLSGKVGNSGEEARALDLARRTSGVKAVKSALQIGAPLQRPGAR